MRAFGELAIVNFWFIKFSLTLCVFKSEEEDLLSNIYFNCDQHRCKFTTIDSESYPIAPVRSIVAHTQPSIG